jgi:hypothetical protein
MAGRFTGELHFTRTASGAFRLTQEFGYIAPDDVAWPVDSGMQTDGASIPRVLWTLVGDPFSGPYLPAAVIHDWYCDIRTRSYRDTHRMFYHAMITSGTPRTQARIMYAGVLYGGPKWNEQASYNAGIYRTARTPRGGPSFSGAKSKTKPDLLVAPRIEDDRLDRLISTIKSEDLNLSELEHLAETQRDISLSSQPPDR